MNDIYASEAHACSTVDGDAVPVSALPIDGLLDQALAAINRGDRVARDGVGGAGVGR
jgi:hypothetical protein